MTRPDNLAPLSEMDDLQLNAYFDGEMAPEERGDYERRLAVEPALRAGRVDRSRFRRHEVLAVSIVSA